MKKILALFGFLLLVRVALGQQKAPQQFTIAADVAAEGFAAGRLKRIDTWIQQFIAEEKVPNIVMLVARNGKIVYHKAFGYSNRERRKPAATTDIFRIASQTKAIASVALMTLYEEGKFLLDDPVSKYIPAFANPQVLVGYDTLQPATGPYQTRPAKQEITIRHLLAHTAGISYEHPLENRPELSL